MPTKIIFLDTEANIKWEDESLRVQTLRLGYALYIQKDLTCKSGWFTKDLEFTDRYVLFAWINEILRKNPKSRIWIVAHNMKYDYALLDMDSFLSGFDIKVFVIAPSFIIKAKRGSSSVLIMSSTNWFKEKLSVLAERFGSFKINHPEWNFETVEGVKTYMEAPDNIVMEYCRQDVIALSEVFKGRMKFQQNNNLGGLNPTAAGQAIHDFAHRFMEENSLLIHSRQDILKLEGESYHGARTECFKLGRFENMIKVDVNSMYPYVMKNELYPTILRANNIINSVPLADIIELLDRDYIIAKCKVDLKEPILPYKKGKYDKLIFPIGRFEAVLSSPEIKYIIDHPEVGKIIEIVEFVSYAQAHIFDKYIDFFYDIKQNSENNSPERQQSKLAMNSLYGKFGQRKHIAPVKLYGEEYELWSMLMDSIDSDTISNKEHTFRYLRIGSSIYRFEDSEEFADSSMPRIASGVTAYARIHLWKLMSIAGSGNYVYCDTDSLIVNQSGYINLLNAGEMDDKRLGALKIEEVGDCEIRGPKNYTFNDHRHIKGIKEKAIETSPNQWEQTQIDTGMSRYRKRSKGSIEAYTVKKCLTMKYEKGIVLEDGTIQPFELHEF